MADFAKILRRVVDIEGGWVDDPNDRGGETVCGISRRYWPDWEGWDVVDRQRAMNGKPSPDEEPLRCLIEAFYRQEFWNRCGGRWLQHEEVMFEIFEMAVNLGVTKANRIAQEALNLLNRNGEDWPDIQVDGKVGPITCKMVERCATGRGGYRYLIRVMNALQGEHYIKVLRGDPTQEKYTRGWLERA